MEFKFAIGDRVKSPDGNLRGVVEERIYHDYPTGRLVIYRVWARQLLPVQRTTLHELHEDEIVADPDWSEEEQSKWRKDNKTDGA